uniref:Uncharacterized protein n=1 Tax=Caenorhabditis japonica TaxID=281687 RepID=A0A8R1E5D6_CAEJA
MSEESAQERYPSTIGGPRSPTSHQEKEGWMGRTHNAKKRWQMDETDATMDSQRWNDPLRKEISINEGSCDPRSRHVIDGSTN